MESILHASQVRRLLHLGPVPSIDAARSRTASRELGTETWVFRGGTNQKSQ